MAQNLVPLMNIKIAGKWMFIPLKMLFIGIDPWPLSSLELQQKKTIILGGNKTNEIGNFWVDML